MMELIVYLVFSIVCALLMVLCGKKAVALSKEYAELKEHHKQCHEKSPMRKKIKKILERIDTKSAVYSLLSMLFCGLFVCMLYSIGQLLLDSLL